MGIVPKKIDISKIPMFFGKTPPLIRNGEFEVATGYNSCREQVLKNIDDLDLSHRIKCYICNKLQIDITTYGAEKLWEHLKEELKKESDTTTNNY